MQQSRIIGSLKVLGLTAGAILVAWIVSSYGMVAGILLISALLGLFFTVIGFQKPPLFYFATIIASFLISALGRYLPGIPFGLSIDVLLLLALLAVLFRKNKEASIGQINNIYLIALASWVIYSLLQLANPSSPSLAAWFYANRGLSFYPLLVSVITFFVIQKRSQLDIFLVVWATWSLAGTFWGIKQHFFGVTDVEQQWLNAGAANTHVLFGKLRVFSFYSDAAQFGASQAHTAMVFGLISIFQGPIRYRLFYLLVGILGFYSLLISGSRGPLAIIAVGSFVYLLFSRNFKVILIGSFIVLGAFVFLKYTSLLQSNYQVQRMRSALDTNDPSLRVRLEREKVLADYLGDKPFGGGIGSAGYWGKRFSPGTLLAEIGTDGHYTRIWMETGIIGLAIYLLMLIVILLYLGRLLWKMHPSLLKQTSLAFYCGFVGICISSYTNGLLTQLPTGTLAFSSLALVVLAGHNKLKE